MAWHIITMSRHTGISVLSRLLHHKRSLSGWGNDPRITPFSALLIHGALLPRSLDKAARGGLQSCLSRFRRIVHGDGDIQPSDIDIDIDINIKMTQQLDRCIATAVLSIPTPIRVTPAPSTCRPRLAL